jgi:hypothetical protein
MLGHAGMERVMDQVTESLIHTLDHASDEQLARGMHFPRLGPLLPRLHDRPRRVALRHPALPSPPQTADALQRLGRVTGPGSLASHLRAADPIHEDLHAGARPQGRYASLRDGLWPPLPPGTAEQEGWVSGQWLCCAP